MNNMSRFYRGLLVCRSQFLELIGWNLICNQTYSCSCCRIIQSCWRDLKALFCKNKMKQMSSNMLDI